MQNEPKLIETAAAPTTDPLPEDYCRARELAWTGCHEEAEPIYRQILAETESLTIRAMVYNDLAALAATAGDARKARELLEKALTTDSQCQAAHENWIALGMAPPPRLDPSAVGSHDGPVKVVIVSGLFNWPSSGGGNVHTVQLAMALQSARCEVHHFFLKFEPWGIGGVEENPIDSQPLRFSESDWSLTEVQSRVGAAVRECAPDFVLVTDCWSLKPWLAEAVSEVPYLLRFDGIECLCPLNNLRVIPHPNRYLER